MIEKIKKAFHVKRERREPDPPGVAAATMQFWFFIAVWAFALLGSLWMLVVFITGSVGRVDWSTSYEATETGVTNDTWLFAADVHWSIAGGLFLFCAAIAIYNAVWLEMRRHTAPGLMRNILTGIGCAVALFMVSGATVVQQRGTDARTRDDVIAAQSAQAGAAGVKAQIDAIDQRLATMRDKRVNNEYAATAANVGVEAYRAQYMNPAIMAREAPERRRLIERALGAAMTAEKLEADKLALSAQFGAATVTAVKAEARNVKAEGFMASTATVLEDARKPVTAILGELLAMTVLSAALAAWASRRQALEGVAPMRGMLLADHSAEAAADAKVVHTAYVEALERGESMEDAYAAAANAVGSAPVKQKALDPKTGEEIEYTEVKTFMRRKPKTKKSGKPGDNTDYDTSAASPADPRVSANLADAADEEARAKGGEMVEVGDENVAAPIPTVASEEAAFSASRDDGGEDDGGGAQRVAEGFGVAEINAPPQNPLSEGSERAAEAEEASQEPVQMAGGATDQGVHELLADEPRTVEAGLGDVDRQDQPTGDVVAPAPRETPEPAHVQLTPEQLPPQVVLDDARYDDLEERGVIVNGEFVSQESQEQIEQADEAPRYPALEDQRSKEVA